MAPHVIVQWCLALHALGPDKLTNPTCKCTADKQLESPPVASDELQDENEKHFL